MLKLGDPAPEFAVPDHHGRTVRLSELKGRDVLLWFYPKADTPGWTKEGCGFRDHWKELEAKGVTVLGASFDSVEKNAAFAEKFGFQFPLLCDTDRKVGLAYGACDDAGAGAPRRISYLIGKDGRIRKAYPKVNAATHAEEVLKDV